MRQLFALLLVLAPLGASQASVSVSAQMGQPLGQQDCASASSITYNLDQNVFSFFCAGTSLTYACAPTSVTYGTGTQAIDLTCQDNSGTAQGLVVNALMDGVQNGNGKGSGNGNDVCNNANSFEFHLVGRKYTWACDNGGGSTKQVTCWTSGQSSDFDLNANQVNMDCVTLVWRSDFEDFEPPSSEYVPPAQ